MYTVSEVCSEWKRKKLFVYVLLSLCCSKHDATYRVRDCTTKLYICSLHFTFFFASNYCVSLFPSPCSYPCSEPHHCWSCSLLPLPHLYSLLNHPAVINKHITHPQFLHTALFTVYISFDAIVVALAPDCLHLLHTHNSINIIGFVKYCAAAKWQGFPIKL